MFTKSFGGKLPNRLFIGWLWLQLTLVISFASLIAAHYQHLQQTWKTAGLIGFLPILFIAWLIAKKNDSVKTSASAVAVGMIILGVFAGSYTGIAAHPNLIRVLYIFGLYTLTSSLSEIIWPGWFAKYPILHLLPTAIVLSVWYSASDQWVVFPTLLELGILGFLIVCVAVEYRDAWNSEHTADNAIDFSLEFLLDIFEKPFNFLRELGGKNES